MMVRRGVGILVLLSLTVAVPYESKEPLRKHKSKPDAHSTWTSRLTSAFQVPLRSATAHIQTSAGTWVDVKTKAHWKKHVGFVNLQEGVTPEEGEPEVRTTNCENDCHWRGECLGGKCVQGLEGRLCTGGVCKCNWGWGGDLCNEPKPWCPDNCRGHGSCDPKTFKCTCDTGFTGPDCGRVVPTCPNSCSGHGRCDPTSGTCRCTDGYTGPSCAVVTRGGCGKNCSGHGACVLAVGEDRVARLELEDFPQLECQCYPGYGGRFCDVGYADPEKCPKACSGHGLCGPDGCVCEKGYIGAGCGTVIPWSVTNPEYGCPLQCSGRGICNNGNCSCAEGWFGKACTRFYHACPNHCSGHGECGPGFTCECLQGYTGDSCEKVVGGSCPRNCNGMGSCTRDMNATMSSPKGTVQPRCECYVPSLVHGRSCGSPLPPVEHGRGNRSAGENHTNGQETEEMVWDLYMDARFDRLFKKPRSPWGTQEEYLANCTIALSEKFEGVKCISLRKGSVIVTILGPSRAAVGAVAEFVLANGLKVGGAWPTLQPLPPVTDDINGEEGFRLPNYDDGVEQGYYDDCPDGCSGHGRCLEGGCQCTHGWRGRKCELPTYHCAFNCSGHGRCTYDSKCVCDPGWAGRTCFSSVPRCPRDCSGHGRCLEGVCVCDDKWGSASCNMTCVDCNATRGTCSHGVCDCKPGWKGTRCNMVDRCVNDCNGRGECTAGTCLCLPGWAGDDCSMQGHDEHTGPPKCKDLEGCNGNGECVWDAQARVELCECHDTHMGDKCDLAVELTVEPRLIEADVRNCSSPLAVQCVDGWINASCSPPPGEGSRLPHCSQYANCERYALQEGACQQTAVKPETGWTADTIPLALCTTGIGYTCVMEWVNTGCPPHMTNTDCLDFDACTAHSKHMCFQKPTPKPANSTNGTNGTANRSLQALQRPVQPPPERPVGLDCTKGAAWECVGAWVEDGCPGAYEPRLPCKPYVACTYNIRKHGNCNMACLHGDCLD